MKDNPNIFKSADATYTLCYLLMMLQTSLHNPKVTLDDRMTFKGFCSCARGINDGDNFPEKIMRNLYDSIE